MHSYSSECPGGFGAGGLATHFGVTLGGLGGPVSCSQDDVDLISAELSKQNKHNIPKTLLPIVHVIF